MGKCELCERGFPLKVPDPEPPFHYGTQSLGMIPNAPCTAHRSFQERAFYVLANYYEAAIVVDFDVDEHAVGLFTEDLNGDGRQRIAVGDGLDAALRAAMTMIGKE